MMVLCLGSSLVSSPGELASSTRSRREILKIFDIGKSGACRDSVYLKRNKDSLPMSSMEGKLPFNKEKDIVYLTNFEDLFHASNFDEFWGKGNSYSTGLA